jgi:hypothetical protein
MSFVGVEFETRAAGTLDHQLLDDVLKRNVIGQIRPPDVFSLSVNADEAARAPRLSDGGVDFGQNLGGQSSHCEPQHAPITWSESRPRRLKSGQFVNLLNIRRSKILLAGKQDL